MDMRERKLGNLYGFSGGNYAGNVYDKDSLCPSISTMGGGGQQPMIIEDFYQGREPRVYEGVAPTIRSEREGLKVMEAINTEEDGTCRTIKGQYAKSSAANFCRGNTFGATGVVECVPVRMVRTEEGKRLRKAYENGEIHHGYNEHRELESRKDGIYNTLTSVQKDNLVLEKKPELQYRIRKLTPRECYRLMDFPDSDFDKAESVISNTRLYKTAGNAIVRAVLMALFLQMNIQGIKNWNDRTDGERRGLLEWE